MKKRFLKRVEQLLPWALLVLSALALLLSLLLDPAAEAPPSGTTDPLAGALHAGTNGESGGESDSLTDGETHLEENVLLPSLKAPFRRAESGSYRGTSHPGEYRVELDAWGEPVELLLSLYAVAATREIVRFYLRREEERYRLSLEIKNE